MSARKPSLDTTGEPEQTHISVCTGICVCMKVNNTVWAYIYIYIWCSDFTKRWYNKSTRERGWCSSCVHYTMNVYTIMWMFFLPIQFHKYDCFLSNSQSQNLLCCCKSSCVKITSCCTFYASMHGKIVGGKVKQLCCDQRKSIYSSSRIDWVLYQLWCICGDSHWCGPLNSRHTKQLHLVSIAHRFLGRWIDLPWSEFWRYRFDSFNQVMARYCWRDRCTSSFV